MAVYKLSEMSVPELNSTAELQRALSQVAQTGGTLIWDQPVQLTGERGVHYTSPYDLTVEFVGRGMIDATQLAGSLASREAILFSGMWGFSSDLTATLPEGSRFVPLSSRQVSAFLPGKQHAVVIASNNGRFLDRSGELTAITGIEDRNGVPHARLAQRTRDTYQAGWAGQRVSVWLLVMPKIAIRGMKLLRNPEPQVISDDAARMGLYLRYVRDFEVSDCDIYGCKYQSYLVLYGNNGVIRNCTADYGPGGATTGSLSYAFAIGPANHVTLDNCRVQRSRCSFSSVGNQASYELVVRNCLFDSSDEQNVVHAVRTHSTTNDIVFEDCVVRPRLSCVGRNVVVRRCVVDGDMGRMLDGLEVSPQVPHVQSVVIEDCVIQGGYTAGIVVSGIMPEVTYDMVRISGCHVAFGRDRGLRGVRVSPSYGNVTIRQLAILSNYIEYPANWPLELSHHSAARRLRIHQLEMSGVINKTLAGGQVARLEADEVRQVVDRALWLHAGQWVQPVVPTVTGS